MLILIKGIEQFSNKFFRIFFSLDIDLDGVVFVIFTGNNILCIIGEILILSKNFQQFKIFFIRGDKPINIYYRFYLYTAHELEVGSEILFEINSVVRLNLPVCSLNFIIKKIGILSIGNNQYFGNKNFLFTSVFIKSESYSEND